MVTTNTTQNITGETNNSVLGDYKTLSNKPSINGVELNGNKTTKELGIEADNDYNNASNKPKINGKELIGDLSTDDLGIEAGGSDINIKTEFDLYGEYEEKDVYNAIAINQLMEIFGFEIMNVMEFVENHEERISALEG
jgi:hypothetical protein